MRATFFTRLCRGLFLIVLAAARTVLAAGTGIEAIIPADRRIDWNPGIPGGIPVITQVFANVKNAPYLAKGDGITDDRAAIQAAINNCPNGQVVYLPAGTYRLSAGLTINYNQPKNHVVIRGDGPDKTKIIYTGTGSITAFTVQNTSSGTTANATSGFTKGSSAVSVDHPEYYNTGDYVLIDQLNDPQLVNNLGETYHSRNNGTRCMGQLQRIASKSVSTLAFDRPLNFTFSASLSPQVWGAYQMSTLSHHIGIEDLYIEKGGIEFRAAIHCWVRNIEMTQADPAFMYLVRCYGCVVRDSTFHHGTNFTGGHAYGLSMDWQCTDCLVENNIYYYLRHSMVLNTGGTGNVFGYNFSDRMFDSYYPDTDWLLGDCETHGGHPYMNLFEGNVVRKILYDNVHGSSSHNTAFRNWAQIEGQGETRAIRLDLAGGEVCALNHYMNFVGNVFGKPGHAGYYEIANIPTETTRVAFKLGYDANQLTGTAGDATVAPTILRHGNFDYMTNSTHWDSAIASRTLPASLYLNARPSWWGGVPWPAIGPDVIPTASKIPAQLRFEGTPNPPRSRKDFDGDRKADLLLRHPSNGTVVLWLIK